MSINKKEKADLYKAINSISRKINEVELKLDNVIHSLNAECNNKISINGGGIDDLGTVIVTHDEAIDELAVMISEMEAK